MLTLIEQQLSAGRGSGHNPLSATCFLQGGGGAPTLPACLNGTLGGDRCKWGLSRATGVKTVHQSGGLHCENGKEAA